MQVGQIVKVKANPRQRTSKPFKLFEQGSPENIYRIVWVNGRRDSCEVLRCDPRGKIIRGSSVYYSMTPREIAPYVKPDFKLSDWF